MNEIPSHVLGALSAYLDGRLADTERQTVEAHLQSCAKCRQHHQELRALRQMLHKSPLLHPPESFFQAILRRIEGKKSPEPGWGLSLKALVSVSVVMFVVLVSRQIHKQNPLAPAGSESEVVEAELRRTEAAKEKKNAAPAKLPAAPLTAKKPVLAEESNTAAMDAAAPSPAAMQDVRTQGSFAAGKLETHSVNATAEAGLVARSAASRPLSAQPPLREASQPTLAANSAAPAEAAKAAPGPLPEWKGVDSGIDQFRTVIIGNTAAWQTLWREHTQFTPTPPPPPNVDFAQNMVVGIYAGQKPSSGYSIEITATRPTAAEFVVEYRETAPPPGGVQTTALTQPFHLRVIPQTTLPILFKKQ